MEKQTVTFTRDKETKTQQRFVAPQGSAVSGSIYIPKETAGDVTSVTVTIEAA